MSTTASKVYQVKDVLKSPMWKAGAASAPIAVPLLQNGRRPPDAALATLPAGVAVFSGTMMVGIERRSPLHANGMHAARCRRWARCGGNGSDRKTVHADKRPVARAVP